MMLHTIDAELWLCGEGANDDDCYLVQTEAASQFAIVPSSLTVARVRVKFDDWRAFRPAKREEWVLNISAAALSDLCQSKYSICSDRVLCSDARALCPRAAPNQ